MGARAAVKVAVARAVVGWGAAATAGAVRGWRGRRR